MCAQNPIKIKQSNNYMPKNGINQVYNSICITYAYNSGHSEQQYQMAKFQLMHDLQKM